MRRVSGFVSLAVLVGRGEPRAGLRPNRRPGIHAEGHILDAMRAPIAGARVTAVPDGQTSASSTTTDHARQLHAEAAARRLHRHRGRGRIRRAVLSHRRAAGRQRVARVRAGRSPACAKRHGQRAGTGYQVPVISSATKTPTPLRDVPQSVTVVTQELIKDQLMMSIGDVVRYVPGITAHQGENNRDQLIIRGNSSSADFFVNGVRDDVQYYRDLYNLDRVEALKGPNAMIFGRGGAGGVVNRVDEGGGVPARARSLAAGRRCSATSGSPPTSTSRSPSTVAVRLNGMFEDSDSFRDGVGLKRYGVTPTRDDCAAAAATTITLGYEHLHDTRVADRGITSFQGRPADVDPRPSTAIRTTATCEPASISASATDRAPRRPRHDSQPDAVRRLRSLLPELRAGSGDRGSDARSRCRPTTTRRRGTNLFNQTDVDLRGVDRARPSHAAGRRRGRPSADRQLPQYRASSTTPPRRCWCRSRRRPSPRR